MYPSTSRHGFTLAELAIVLVILGLLVGGIVFGSSLIRNTEMKTVISEYRNIVGAMTQFKGKYSYLPGDMPNAVKYWGAQAGGTADGTNTTCTHLTTPATTKATCNGNGDGFLGSEDNYGYGIGYDSTEATRSWQHMLNAGMLGMGAGLSGIRDPQLGAGIRIGVNVPASKIDKAGWAFMGTYGYGTVWDTTNAFTDLYTGNATLMFGANPGQVVDYNGLWRGVIRPQEAENIDAKIDDGRPSSGAVFSYKSTATWFTTPCVSAGNATYAVTNQSMSCSLVFLTGF